MLSVCSFGAGSIGTEVENRAGRAALRDARPVRKTAVPCPRTLSTSSCLAPELSASRRRLRFRRAAERVALVDRLPEAAGETSFGNSGIVQTEGVLPYLFPRALGEIARAAVEPRSARPHAPWLAAFDRAGDLALFPGLDATEKGRDRQGHGPAPVRRGGRAPEARAGRGRVRAFARRRLDQGLSQRARAGSGACRGRGAQAVRRQADLPRPRRRSPRSSRMWAKRRSAASTMPSRCRRSDPGALIQSYAALFVKRGGRMERGDALSLEPSGSGWMVTTDSGRLAARDVVIALGPWSDELARRFGLRLPFFVKRGYHMHYEAKGNAGLTRPVLDLERGYLVTPMARGLRLTTGRRIRPARRSALAGASRAGRALRAGTVPHRRPQGRRALARPAPLPAGHAPGHRAVPRQARPLARLRPPPSGPDARPDHRPASGGPDDRRGAVRRSRPVQGGAVRRLTLIRSRRKERPLTVK